MACSFLAEVVSFEPIEGILTVGFSETPSGDGRYLLLQREEHESEQDRNLGLVGEHLELNDQRYGAYSAVESARLHRSKIEFFITTGARAKIGEEEIDVAFRLSDTDFKSLRSALAEILGASRVQLA